MEKIDYRHHFVLVLDTETANTITINDKLDMSNVLFYDLGWSVVDTKGRIYNERSFVNKDIFTYEKELMNSAYYSKKIPLYEKELAEGSRILASTYEIRKQMLEDMALYRITEIVAHNARFDVNALNSTIRWTSKSKFRYFLPYGTEVWDSMLMARSVVAQMPTYRRFCEEHGFVTKTGRLSLTAENLYKFITKNLDFVESHTGLEDVQIERVIMFYCYRQHKKMKKVLFSAPTENTPPTPLQMQINKLYKYQNIL